MRLNADENLMSSYTEMQPERRVPIKAITLALSLLLLGFAAIVSGLVITYTNITHKDHGVALFFIGGLMFLPGLYHTHEFQTLSPDTSFRAAEEAKLGTGVQYLAVHWGDDIAAFTDGERVVVSAFSGTAATLPEGGARASLLVDLNASQGAPVSALTWLAPATSASSPESSSSPVPSVLCVACEDLLIAFQVHWSGEQLVSRQLNLWQAAGNKWRALCGNSEKRVVAALGLRTVHVYGLEQEAAVAAVKAPPAGAAPFTAFAWLPAADPHLALPSTSGDVILCSWKIGSEGWCAPTTEPAPSEQLQQQVLNLENPAVGAFLRSSHSLALICLYARFCLRHPS
ncbi:hypothetical protein CYMTET_45956 [Cymbomonas tetramitiformis]|uniref:Transmembrane protein 230 n=1 Tax=Cymbomonas tetramitiformis TaxID=36881 RepID=A0AAE0BYC6_9CHLO|nr:hypothetical protein CYMTET_45956 [Cymbomonas tetramitiformis]